MTGCLKSNLTSVDRTPSKRYKQLWNFKSLLLEISHFVPFPLAKTANALTHESFLRKDRNFVEFFRFLFENRLLVLPNYPPHGQRYTVSVILTIHTAPRRTKLRSTAYFDLQTKS